MTDKTKFVSSVNFVATTAWNYPLVMVIIHNYEVKILMTMMLQENVHHCYCWKHKICLNKHIILYGQNAILKIFCFHTVSNLQKVTRKLNVFAFALLYTYLIWGEWHSNASTCWTDMLEGCSGWETQRLLELAHQLPAVQSVAEIDKPWWSVHHWAQIVD